MRAVMGEVAAIFWMNPPHPQLFRDAKQYTRFFWEMRRNKNATVIIESYVPCIKGRIQIGQEKKAVEWIYPFNIV